VAAVLFSKSPDLAHLRGRRQRSDFEDRVVPSGRPADVPGVRGGLYVGRLRVRLRAAETGALALLRDEAGVGGFVRSRQPLDLGGRALLALDAVGSLGLGLSTLSTLDALNRVFRGGGAEAFGSAALGAAGTALGEVARFEGAETAGVLGGEILGPGPAEAL
jgi:hypothetical protein